MVMILLATTQMKGIRSRKNSVCAPSISTPDLASLTYKNAHKRSSRRQPLKMNGKLTGSVSFSLLSPSVHEDPKAEHGAATGGNGDDQRGQPAIMKRVQVSESATSDGSTSGCTVLCLGVLVY